MIFENRCSVLFRALASCACKAIFGKINWEEPTKIKTCMYTVCWSLNIIYDDVRKGKTCDRGTISIHPAVH